MVAGGKKYLLKWREYPDKINCWIDEEQLTPA